MDIYKLKKKFNKISKHYNLFRNGLNFFEIEEIDNERIKCYGHNSIYLIIHLGEFKQ